MKYSRSHLPVLIIFLIFINMLCVRSLAAQQMAASEKLKKLTLEQLLEIEVTTASRKPQPYSETASAVSVLTSETIRRSGATNFPDLLRLAAGMHVVRNDSRSWGISTRGLNLNTANKLQVLMDGRILYTPLFGGVFWDVQDYILQEIDRIEVTRGPGATLWGGNAVNGVINILTLPAQDTQGGLVEIGAGNEEHVTASARYGSKIGDGIFYRGYFKFFNHDDLVFANGEPAQDDWEMGRGGFRMDTDLTQTSTLTIQGDVYHGEVGFSDRNDGTVKGGNVLGRWKRFFEGHSDLQLLVYYDRSDRKIPAQFQEKRDSFDVDIQHRFQFAERHDFVWGFNYRASADETEDIGTIRFEPNGKTIHHFSGFIQDDISIIPGKLIVVAGTKLEENTFSGLELEPNFRIAWLPHSNHTLWGAIARAVRVPSRLDTDLRFFPLPGVLAIVGNPDFRPEEVVGVEGGYRIAPRPGLLFDLALFHSVYDSLITLEARSPGEPSIIGNGANAQITGVTIAVNFDPATWLRTFGSLSLLNKNVELDPNSNDISNAAGEGNDPDYYGTFYVRLDPVKRLQLDMILRSSGDLPSPPVPGYVTMDLRFAWLINEKLEISLTGQNLLQDTHPEFGAPGPFRKEVERSVYGKIAWLF